MAVEVCYKLKTKNKTKEEKKIMTNDIYINKNDW